MPIRSLTLALALLVVWTAAFVPAAARQAPEMSFALTGDSIITASSRFTTSLPFCVSST